MSKVDVTILGSINVEGLKHVEAGMSTEQCDDIADFNHGRIMDAIHADLPGFIGTCDFVTEEFKS